MYVVGLTGGIASGKTTVANLIAEKGIELVDADIVARDVVAVGSQGLKAIAAHFGTTILQTDGSLDRSRLREIIFSNDAEKTWLNNLLHPLIRKEMEKQLQASQSLYTLFVVPLLIENDLTNLCDHVLVVDIPEETQIARTIKRDNVSATQAESILSAQASRQTRLQAADSVLVNDDIDALTTRIERLHQKFLELATAAMAD